MLPMKHLKLFILAITILTAGCSHSQNINKRPATSSLLKDV